MAVLLLLSLVPEAYRLPHKDHAIFSTVMVALPCRLGIQRRFRAAATTLALTHIVTLVYRM